MPLLPYAALRARATIDMLIFAATHYILLIPCSPLAAWRHATTFALIYAVTIRHYFFSLPPRYDATAFTPCCHMRDIDIFARCHVAMLSATILRYAPMTPGFFSLP